MSDENPYKRALARREELEAELKRINEFLDMYKEFSGVSLPSTPPPRVRERVRRSASDGVPETGMTQPQFVRRARRLLKERGKPATRSELLQMFRENGVSVGGANESKNLGTKLWRARDVFVNIPPHGYWLRDEACAEVGYQPSYSDD